MARLTVILTAVILLGQAAGAGAEPLGRLFFSPDERAMLDRGRNQTSRSAMISTEEITLNGIVRRSGGKTTAWINQVPQRENENPQGISVLRSPARSPVVPLQLPSGKQVRLKPGQTYDTTQGRVREGYEDSASPARPKPEK